MRQRVDGADDEDDDDDDDDALTSVDHLGGQPRFLAASLSLFFPSFLPSFFLPRAARTQARVTVLRDDVQFKSNRLTARARESTREHARYERTHLYTQRDTRTRTRT